MTLISERSFFEWICFSGVLRAGDGQAPITFRARVDDRGELHLEFDPISKTRQSAFIIAHARGSDLELGTFILTGSDDSGIELATDDLQFHSWKHDLKYGYGSCILLHGSCSMAIFRWKSCRPIQDPVLQMQVRGLKCELPSAYSCSLGVVSLNGIKNQDDRNAISALFQVRATRRPADVEAWRNASDALLEHLRVLMSIAPGNELRAPIYEFACDNLIEIHIYAQMGQVESPIPNIHRRSYDTLFKASLDWYFSSEFKRYKIAFAIEWFTMEANHIEVRLINTMTALENLIDTHMTEKDSLFLTKGQFRKLSKSVRSQVSSCIEELGVLGSDDITAGICEKIKDLNRQSFLRKLRKLSCLWNVPLHGITEENIRSVKNTRDGIIHRGRYLQDDDHGIHLWQSFTLAKEITLRFLLAVIKYEGSYISYVGGSHVTSFPPRVKIADE